MPFNSTHSRWINAKRPLNISAARTLLTYKTCSQLSLNVQRQRFTERRISSTTSLFQRESEEIEVELRDWVKSHITTEASLGGLGVLTWAPKMESDLLLHLKRHLRTPSNPQLVLDEIDHYCSTSRWMMHCGPYKGDIIEAEVKKSNKKTCLELGTYCGYASIRIARSMDEMGTLYTIEEKQEIADIAKEIIRMTGLAKVKQIVGNSSDIIPDLRNRFPEISSFDFIYINHDKTKYLHDLLLLESLGFLKPGTRVVADHVRLFRVYEYLVHVRDKTLYSSSEFRKALLAYDKPQAEHLYDGMEVSVYKGGRVEEPYLLRSDIDVPESMFRPEDVEKRKRELREEIEKLLPNALEELVNSDEPLFKV